MALPLGPMSLAFAGGAAAFAHCLGMCGGFSLALAEGEGGRPLLRHLSWQGGRAFAYMFLGSLAGFSGWFFSVWAQFQAGQEFVSAVAGLMMVLFAILQFKAAGKEQKSGGITAAIQDLFAPLLTAPTAASSFCLGVVTGFLPCPIVWGFAVLAASTGTALSGMQTMAALAAGTAAPLFFLGMTGRLLPASLRRRARLMGPTVLLLAGIVTLLRPLPFFHKIMSILPGTSCCEVAPQSSPQR